MISAARAGDVLHASTFSLPAAATTSAPAFINRTHASSIACVAGPPSDTFTTAGLRRFAAIQSSPAITPLIVPLPEQSITRTDTRLAPGATPYVAPPTVP